MASPGFGARGHELKEILYGVECQSLCGSEVPRKITQSEVEGARAPVPHSCDAND